MIQRIQTVYLLISGLLAASLIKLNVSEMSTNNELYAFSARGIFDNGTLIFNGFPIMIFVGIIVLLHFAIIVMYKKRIWQIRTTVFAMVLLLGLFGLFFYLTYLFGTSGANIAFKIPIIFPLAAIVLDFLAIRAIRKDEALIRSLNRIR